MEANQPVKVSGFRAAALVLPTIFSEESPEMQTSHDIMCHIANGHPEHTPDKVSFRDRLLPVPRGRLQDA